MKCDACGHEVLAVLECGKFKICAECKRMMEIMDSVLNAKCDGTCHRGNS